MAYQMQQQSTSRLLPAFDPVPTTTGLDPSSSLPGGPASPALSYASRSTLSTSSSSSNSTPTSLQSTTLGPQARSSSLSAGVTHPVSSARTVADPSPGAEHTNLGQDTPRRSVDELGPTNSTIEDWLYPPIQSVCVPYHSKQDRHCYYACRVVPVPDPSANNACSPVSCNASFSPASFFSSNGRPPSVTTGKMAMANAREPHTVFRRWSEFVDFRARLASAFPIANQPFPRSAGFPSEQGSAVAIPRLSSKKSVFFGRQTILDERLSELDLFTRSLFDLPHHVKNSVLVRDFFRLRESDVHSGSSSPSPSSISTPPARSDSPWGDTPNDGGDSFAQFLAAAAAKDEENISPNATIRAFPPGRAQKARPRLPLHASSTNLRVAASSNDLRSQFGHLRPAQMDRSASFDPASVASRSSGYAESTTSTITPVSISKAQALQRVASPLTTTATASSSSKVLTQSKDDKKRPGLLRTFRSLGDLRSSANSQIAPALPSEPVPQLSASRMLRAVTQPMPSLVSLVAPGPAGLASSAPLQSSSPAPNTSPFAFPPSSNGSSSSSSLMPQPLYAPAMTRHRSANSKSSSTSSFEDVWGSSQPHHAQPMADPSAAFRRHPSSGRVDRIPSTDLRPRRPSMPTRGSGSNGSLKPIPGHTPQSASLSSLESKRSSRSSVMSRSLSEQSADGRWTRRDSTDYSFSDLSTPSTPQSELGSSKHQQQQKDLELALSNKVPLPMFFPVPPKASTLPASTRMEAFYSQDMTPHTPSGRRPSHEFRPRATSSSSSSSLSSSRRLPLDTILASPRAETGIASPASATSTGSAASLWSPSSAGVNGSLPPHERPHVTFKLLHPKSNLVVRVNRSSLTRTALLEQAHAKFATVGVHLEGDWGLLYHVRSSSTASSSQAPVLIVTDEDLTWVLARSAMVEKISLHVMT
ncbi:BZ3500_MvSof-1268-A1-R1_Chr6-3g08722 [Microbotryum saponariae]|uniref:BZ3500_MvSof-1268-A1-R1_Chr6-3g08722 protein n=1 Tax=Microbotryum saponariae TaxID=289078 RepID=A0A2X0LCC3_9BASI|nr:BZ3500_MvSof-1268-A1-R1_Chr6-3g08722 [Microbotryum saponariae]SDA07323.1 BZ3501_MvSof-1269-A2-R1_Chr6-2g08425 [Microbotryum saponariae]